jgi:hypothetical protein
MNRNLSEGLLAMERQLMPDNVAQNGLHTRQTVRGSTLQNLSENIGNNSFLSLKGRYFIIKKQFQGRKNQRDRREAYKELVNATCFTYQSNSGI